MPDPEPLNVAPEEAIEHFRAKGYHVGFDWRDTAAAQHIVSFTVAKAMEVDILRDIRGAVNRAIAEGRTFEQFRDELEPMLRRRGWWGRREMRDPVTGEIREVQLGSPRRLRTIFDTNIRTAYAHGRWKRIERVADARPFLRYVSVLDDRTRPQHRAWHGTVLPWDHPWWNTFAPPNGWGCRCIIQQFSQDELDDFGYEVSSSPPASHGRLWTNSRTGETRMVPSGIDPGWDHNVGKTDLVGEARERLAAKVQDAPAAVRRRVEDDLDSYIAAGRTERERMVQAAGGIDAPDFPERFRADLRRRLVDERGAGTVAADIGSGRGGSRTAARVRQAAEVLPASWVRQGNTVPVNGIRGSKRGFYRAEWGGRAAEISVASDVGNPLHEYHHHLQRAMPGLDVHYANLHRRRTRGERRVAIGGGRGREDGYVRPYTGREYGAAEAPLEVLTMAMQMTFHPVWRTDHLRDLVRKDPEMLDLALGTLFHYDP